MKIWAIVALVFLGVVVFLFTYGKRVQMDRMAILLECREFEQFDKVANSFLSKLVVKHYDLEIAKLNSYLVRKDKINIDKQFDLLLKASVREDRKISLIMRAFEYYVYEKNRSLSKDLLKEIKARAPKEYADYCQKEFDIVIEGSKEYIEDLEKDVEKFDGQRKMANMYLLQLSYENAGNTKKAKEIERKLLNK